MSRLATIGLLAACSAFGAYSTIGTGIKNGLFDSIGRSAGRKVVDKYFPSGPAPYKTTYTGIEAIDNPLVIIIAFFTYIVDGPRTWDVVLVYWYLMAQFCAGWTLLSLEGLRKANKGRVVSWTGTMGFILQIISYAITVPTYLLTHLLTSPINTIKANIGDVSVDTSDSAILPISTTLSFVIPAIMMYLRAPAFVSASTHYTWQAIWQIFPVTQGIYHVILRSILPGPSSSSKSIRAHLVGVYRYILFLSFVPQVLLLTVAVIPAGIVPEVLRPVFEQVDLVSAFVPYWPWNSPITKELAGVAAGVDSTSVVTADGKAELVKLFLQWDVYCGGVAILAWAVFNYCAVEMSGKSVFGSVWAKVVIWTLVGGPVGAAAMLLLERDQAALGGIRATKKTQ